jgi:hypothetical protein
MVGVPTMRETARRRALRLRPRHVHAGLLALLLGHASGPVAAQAQPETEVERTTAEWVEILATQAGSGDVALLLDASLAVTEAQAEAVPHLVAALATPRPPAAVIELAEALASIGKEAAAALPTLQRVLAESNGDVRYVVAAAIAEVDAGAGKPLVPLLERCLADPSRGLEVRAECIDGLAALGGGAGARALIATLADDSAHLRKLAAGALATGSDEVVREPLSRLRADPDAEVRLQAARRLMDAAPPVPGALAQLAREVCKVDDGEAHVAIAQLEPREVSADALAVLAGGLRSSSPHCRRWTAVLLGRLDPDRGVRGLPALRETIADRNRGLGVEAERTIAAMGCAARSLLPELRAAVEVNPRWAWVVEKVESDRNCPLSELTLIATEEYTDGWMADLLTPGGRLIQVAVDQALRDFTVKKIEPGVMEVERRRVAEDLSLSRELRRFELFSQRAPEPLPAATSSEPTSTIDIDFEGDLEVLLQLMQPRTGQGVMLAPGTSGKVRLAVRRGHFDTAMGHALEAAGFEVQRAEPFTVVGQAGSPELRREQIDIATNEPISLRLGGASLAEVMKALADVLSLDITLDAPGPRSPVTIYAAQVPVVDLLEVLIATRGWTHRLDGRKLLLTARGGG